MVVVYRCYYECLLIIASLIVVYYCGLSLSLLSLARVLLIESPSLLLTLAICVAFFCLGCIPH